VRLLIELLTADLLLLYLELDGKEISPLNQYQLAEDFLTGERNVTYAFKGLYALPALFSSFPVKILAH